MGTNDDLSYPQAAVAAKPREDQASWWVRELNKDGFSVVRTGIVCVSCVAGLSVIQTLGLV